MKNFELYNPIRMVFGTGEFNRLGELASVHGNKPLLVTGQKSARETGVLDKAIEMLKEAGMEPVLFEGIEPNPRLGTCQEAARKAREENCDMIIGLGGGSVMDASKVIAFGYYDPDIMWNHIAHWLDTYSPVEQALPIVLVSTLAATGSEGDAGAVITNWETHEKLGVFSEHMFPKVSIIDPELTVSVNPEYTRDGAVDMLIHVLESYFNGDDWATFSDHMTEGLMIEVMIALEKVLENPRDLEARGQLSYLGAIALQGFINRPRGGVFPLHMMEHPLSGHYDISHGRGLALLLPRWLKYVYHEKPDKIIRLGDNVFRLDLENYHPFEAAEKTIERLSEWLEEIGSWFYLDDLGIPNDPAAFREMADEIIRIYGGDEGVIGGIKPLSADDIVEIYSSCVRVGVKAVQTTEPEEEHSEEETTGKREQPADQEGKETVGASQPEGEEVEIVEEVIVVEEGEPMPEGLESEEYVVVEEVVEEKGNGEEKQEEESRGTE